MNSFAEDVLRGLSCSKKYLPSMYFYDEEGDRLFKEITQLEEYYLTRSEEEILHTYRQNMLAHFSSDGEGFNLIELGPGDGMKSRILLNYFLCHKADFEYYPIDISENVLGLLIDNLHRILPKVKVKPMNMDYFEALDELHKVAARRNVVLFLGSNIGNFEHKDAVKFLCSLHEKLDSKDLLLVGLDLKKDPEKILKAYNDSKGITKDFNLNYLERINRELGGDFDPGKFLHKPCYDEERGEAKSYLRSNCRQDVHIKELKRTFSFEKGEDIFMEVSRKFDLKDIEMLAEKSGFKVLKHYSDGEKNFTNVLWQRN